MRIILLIFFFVLPISCICFAQSNTTETLTITTYYPSPYGVYRNLKLNPTDAVPADSALSRGVMYYNNSTDSLQIYTNSGWVNLTGGGGGGGGYWAEDTATQYIHNTNSGGKTYITGPGDANGEILEVDGDMRVKDKNGSTLLYLTRLAGTDTTGISFGTWTGPQDRFHLGIIDSPPRFRIDNGTTDFLNVNSIGNVGIGTTVPLVPLQIETNTITSPLILKSAVGDVTNQSGVVAMTPYGDRLWLTYGCYLKNNQFYQDGYRGTSGRNFKMAFNPQDGVAWYASTNFPTTWWDLTGGSSVQLWNEHGTWVGNVTLPNLPVGTVPCNPGALKYESNHFYGCKSGGVWAQLDN
ncbi:MAG: hypothetical protein NTY14_07300 [Candidatus Omnitrophica bacterium]|nr:hypothetical protein [Candidatus Omnitrophota bacterium]